MELEYAEFCLSGFTRRPFAAGVAALRAVGQRYPLRKLSIREPGDRSTTIEPVGLAVDLSRAVGATTWHGVYAGAEAGLVTLHRRGDGGANIDGYLPVSWATQRLPELSPITILAAYADFACAAALALQAEVFTVGNEWCEEGIGGEDIIPPELLAVFAEHHVAAIADELRAAGAVLDAPRPGLVRVWLQARSRFAAGLDPDPRVTELLAGVLRGLY